MRPAIRSARAAILAGGLIVGVLDIADAFIVHGVRSGASPVRILQSIASGLLGRDAYQGGAATAALGAALHLFIATTIAAVYVAASVRVPVLARRPITCGFVYGLGVFLFMQYGVTTLSRIGWRPPAWPLVVNGVAIHMLGVGLPVALLTARWHRTRVDRV